MNLNYTNLPGWIERNWLFRKLFLIRKLYLTRTSFRHNSQFAEDVTLGRLFPREFKGFFVDVGCFHPKKYNNTWRLYKRGWRGINIDVDSIKVEGFNIVRRQDTNITCAVSDSAGEVTFYSSGFYSLGNSLDSHFGEGKPGYMKKTVKSDTLTAIIDGTSYKNRQIDFLSVDVEGHDAVVLKSLDFDRYAPRMIAVEAHRALFTEIVETELYQFLMEKGYCLVGWTGLTLLMASRSMQATLAVRTQ